MKFVKRRGYRNVVWRMLGEKERKDNVGREMVSES